MVTYHSALGQHTQLCTLCLEWKKMEVPIEWISKSTGSWRKEKCHYVKDVRMGDIYNFSWIFFKYMKVKLHILFLREKRHSSPLHPLIPDWISHTLHPNGEGDWLLSLGCHGNALTTEKWTSLGGMGWMDSTPGAWAFSVLSLSAWKGKEDSLPPMYRPKVSWSPWLLWNEDFIIIRI